jgi:hypothetical protein
VGIDVTAIENAEIDATHRDGGHPPASIAW